MDELQNIKSMIFKIRGYQVMLDADLAKIYQVETKVLNQTVKRNIDRFPPEFMFRLTKDEYDNLRSQFVTSKDKYDNLRSHFATSKDSKKTA
jgi:5'-deoxynucleotidase YfbR-like HD superfamily hydrolase